MEKSLLSRTMDGMQKNRERLDKGEINCIPYPFARSQKMFPGMERAEYIDILAATKVGKSQFLCNLLFEALMELYWGKSIFDINIIYFALEETPERIMQRFMSWLLYRESNGKIRVSPLELRSTMKKCPQEAMDFLEQAYIQDILEFFEAHITFPPRSESNPTGIYNYCRDWAEARGKRVEKEYEEMPGIIKKSFDHYEPDDPNAFNIIVIDTINLVEGERDMREHEKLRKISEYCCKYLRNDYFFTILAIQQLNFESYSLEASKQKRFEPNLGSAGNSKEVLRDFDTAIALYKPYEYEPDTQYCGYDIRKLNKRGIFAKYMFNRNGESGGVTPLFFDGAVSHFWELPRPKDTGAITAVYNYCDQMLLPHTSEELANLNPFLKKEEPKKEKKETITFLNLLFNHKK